MKKPAFLLVSALFAACSPPPMMTDGGMTPANFRPVRVSARAMPEQTTYARMSEVELVLEGQDMQGATGRIANPTWTAMPATAATAGTMGRFTLAQEGEVSFRGCTMGPMGELCATVRLLVDDAAPTLEVQSPTPGQELGGDGARSIEVRGRVTSGRMRSVFVNGTAAMLQSDGSFTAQVTPRFGMNHLEVVGSDGVRPEARAEMDVLWAERYLPAVVMGRPSASVDDAVVLHLGRRFFDDGMALDTTMMPVRTDDLADVLRLVLMRLDRTLLPANPVVNASGLMLNINALTVPDAQVQVNIIDGGVELFVRATRVRVDTAGGFMATGVNVSLDGGLVATISAYAKVQLVHMPGMPVRANVQQFTMALEGVEGQFRAAETNALFAVLEGALRTRVETALSGAVEPLLRTTIPNAIASVFNALDGAIRNQMVPLNTPPLPMITLTLNGNLSSLTAEDRRRMRAGLRLVSSTNAMMARFPMARGIPVPEGAMAPEPFLLEPRLQLGVRVATLNGLLHTLWNSGLLELDLTPVLPMNLRGLVMNPRLTAKLPPIARSARAGETTDLVLSLGQLEFEGVNMGVTSRFGISMDAGVNVTLQNNRLALMIAEQPSLRVWVISQMPAGRSTLLSPDVLRSTLLETVWPQLRMSIGSSLSFDLPIPPLDALASVSPSLRGFRLSLSASERIAERGGYLVFDGELRGELP